MKGVIVGEFGPELETSLRGVLERAGLATGQLSPGASARETLARDGETDGLRVVIFDGTCGDDGFVAWMRDQPQLFAIPALSLVPFPSEKPFRDAFFLGADDVVLRADLAGLARRIQSLLLHDPSARPASSAGTVLVALRTRERGILIGRLLRMAGFDVVLAPIAALSAPEELRGAGSYRLAVVSFDEDDEDPAGVITSLRKGLGQGELPVVLVTGAEELSSTTLRRRMSTSVAVTSETSPLPDVLFLANEVLNPQGRVRRLSRRVLHRSFCSFREEGVLESRYGITYNISREGAYIRSFDAPPVGSRVWIELSPAQGVRVVHLRGEVVWTRAFAEPIGLSSPPGFAVKFDPNESPHADARLYLDAYRARVRNTND